MNLEELNRMSANEVFDMLGTPEGQAIVEAAIQQRLESDPALCERIGQGFLQLIDIATKIGIKLKENQDEILAFFRHFRKLLASREES